LDLFGGQEESEFTVSVHHVQNASSNWRNMLDGVRNGTARYASLDELENVDMAAFSEAVSTSSNLELVSLSSMCVRAC